MSRKPNPVPTPGYIDPDKAKARADVATLRHAAIGANRCPTCGDAPTYQTPDGTYWDGNAHFWRLPEPPQKVE